MADDYTAYLRREFGERWTFHAVLQKHYGRTVLDHVIATPKAKDVKRRLRFSSPAELAHRIREIEKEGATA